MKLPWRLPIHDVLILAGLLVLLPVVRGYPYLKQAHSSTPALILRPQPLHHDSQQSGLPRRLTIRAPGDGQSRYTTEMTMFRFRALAAILPIAPAAHALEQFYQGIADAATHEWASRPRLMGFSYSEAGFTLAMQSWGDTIPWHVVATIANRCWMLAASGLPYLFDVAYTSPDGRIVVSITLRLAAEAIASVVDSNTAGSGPGSGSHPFGTIPAWAVDANGLPGDNLNQDWREGSVPSVNSEQAHYP